jgi:4,5-dihydroxyphthalate decarboxylase
MTETRRLSLACGDYDINRALIEGRVTPRGVELTVLAMPSPERHARMAANREFDICELSMATYLAMLGTGDRSLVAIPAFPHRRFRHGFMFVGPRSRIETPRDLNGGRIGLRTWQTTAGLWLRGILHDDHGLDLRSVDWVTQDAEDVATAGLDAFRLHRVESGTTVVDQLVAGELDALIYPESPDGAGVRRFWTDAKAEEITYFRRTGIFPIMHAVVIRRELVEEMPWLAREVLEAFRRSKDEAFAAMRDPRRISLAWWREAREEQEAILGADPWAYDVARNRGTLETLLRYAREQGFVRNPLSLEELFVPETVDDLPGYV